MPFGPSNSIYILQWSEIQKETLISNGCLVTFFVAYAAPPPRTNCAFTFAALVLAWVGAVLNCIAALIHVVVDLIC